MSEVEIRPAVPADVAGFVASSIALFAEDAGTRDPTVNTDWPRQHGERRFAENLPDTNRLTLVAVADGQVVGHLTGLWAEPSEMRPVSVATLASLYVRPEHRSGGVGFRLADTFRQWARERGADRIAVTAYATNHDAIRFYQRFGFVPLTTVLEMAP
ncbi:GNAT family N-acetyltransferase [Fodinicola feengrottensis]|uniref:GNAT family N-acetyltransferase n=1 Tax=Fodinicola feengrottensis TaxID=435914 RepID=A0ABP4V0G7_9ACTN|nr:GNAT family N-acetyltransferase [Fodinicola feengrottensis]